MMRAGRNHDPERDEQGKQNKGRFDDVQRQEIFVATLGDFGEHQILESFWRMVFDQARGTNRLETPQIDPGRITENPHEGENTGPDEMRPRRLAIDETQRKSQRGKNNGNELQERRALGIERRHVVQDAVADRLNAAARSYADLVKGALVFATVTEGSMDVHAPS